MAITWKAWASQRSGNRPAANYGGMGGFFQRGMRWKDYLERYLIEDRPRIEELRAEILRRPLWRDGSWLQDQAGEGMPVWDDGAVFAASYRAWGDLLAAVWSTELDHDYCYTDFYCDVPDLPKRPRPSSSLPACGSFG